MFRKKIRLPNIHFFITTAAGVIVTLNRHSTISENIKLSRNMFRADWRRRFLATARITHAFINRPMEKRPGLYCGQLLGIPVFPTNNFPLGKC